MNNHNHKLLVIDIDGTLIRRNGDISDRNRRALARVVEAGMQVSVSTGRSLKSSLSIIEGLLLKNYHIFFDGALVSGPDPEAAIYSRPIKPDMVQQMIQLAREQGIDLELYSTTRYFSERETWSTETHRRFFGIEATITGFDGLWQREKIVKGGLIVRNTQDAAGAKIFSSRFAASLCFSQVMTPAYPDVTFVNILAPETSKGIALEALAAHLEIPMAAVVAVGDGKNDIPSLSAAGLGIAMGNAHDELKKVADHITLDVDDDGLAVAIEELLL